MLSVQRLAAELGLSFVAAEKAARRPIRWIHISELADPTPWLSGGELLLTTGLSLTDAKHQRAFVRRLDEKGAAGIGFGTGFDHETVPKPLADEAAKRDLPVFEVPYEVPFIAVTERAFTDLVNEQYGVLERSIEIHERLEGLVLAERGLAEILGVVAAAIGGPSILFDDGGNELARSAGKRELGSGPTAGLAELVSERSAADRFSPFVVEDGPLAGAAMAVPVPAGRAGTRAWLVVTKRGGRIGPPDRLLARQAAMVVGLELMRERAVRETERRLSGDVLAEALGGGLDADAIAGRLRPFGVTETAAVLLFELDDPAGAQGALESALERATAPALVGVTSITGTPLLCGIVAAGDADTVELAREARTALSASAPRVRAAASRGFPIGSLRRAFHEARYALEATAFSNGDAPEVASHADLGAFTLLLSVSDENALRIYADDLLGPIDRAEGSYGPELLRSLEAFIESNGQWESAARSLYCHRHTLRYRIRKVEQLTGRDLSDARNRIELWLALRARELVR
jgi:purine catabolism regulator